MHICFVHQADRLNESVFDILDREADNSDSLEVGSCLHMCIHQTVFPGGRGLCCVTPLLEGLDQEWVHMYWSG